MEGEEEKEQGEEEIEEDEDRTPSLRLGGGDEEEDGGDEEEAVSRDPNTTPADKPGAAPEAQIGNASDPNDDAAGSPDDPSAAAAVPSQPPDEADDSNKKKKGVKRKQNGDGETVKRTKKKTNVWCKSTTRKSTKKGAGRAQAKAVENESSIFLTPVMPRVEDGPDLPVVLSKFHKAEKVELSSDQLTAASCKGYRMVRATRGVVEGAWYFEIHVEHLGSTGHARLGWCTLKGDVQAPVGYDTHGYAYRDLEGTKVHAALREPYGEPYVEGDTIGFYINLPNGAALAPKPPEIVSFKGAPYTPDVKEEPLKPLPGSEIAFFKNGVYQGTAYKDIYSGRYYPAASMYTLPNQPNCSVRFNFGPDFTYFPSDFHGLTPPEPMSNAPYAEELVVGAQAAGLQNGQASTSNPPKLQETEVVTNGTPKGEVKKGKGKPPKHSLKNGKNKGGNGKQAPGLELAVEVPIESASMVSHRIPSTVAITTTK